MVRKHKLDYDLIVIGSGAAGSIAALTVAHADKKVAIVEMNEFGGESPNWGDIPLHSLLHVANLYDSVRNGAHFGLRSSTLGYNFPSLMQWKNKVISRTGAGGNKRYYEQQGIDTFHGRAHFISPNELSVGRKRITAHNILIATGSHFTLPDFYGIESITPLNPRTALELNRSPKSLFIIGGGPTGVEYAQLFATFGTKIYISEVGSRLLPDEDEEVGDTIAGIFHKKYNTQCLTESQVVAVEKKGLGMRVTYSRGGTEHSVYVDDILVTNHRTPSTDIGLENAHVTYSQAGIDVNTHLQTSAKHIYAAGNVLGDNHPTHIALMQGRIVARNILSKEKTAPNYLGTPKLTHINPGVASVGLTENECIKRDLTIKQAMAPLGITARSNTNDFRDGFVKLIADKDNVIIGASIVAPGAAEAIHELTLAIKYSMTAYEVASTPHAFLSWSDAVRIAATKLTHM